jgi:hypothetical protein
MITFITGRSLLKAGTKSLLCSNGAGEYYRLKEFSEAFSHGQQMLQDGAFAMDAVQAVVERLEDSAYFNAGRGSVFTNAGTHEMDASIMDGTECRSPIEYSSNTVQLQYRKIYLNIWGCLFIRQRDGEYKERTKRIGTN